MYKNILTLIFVLSVVTHGQIPRLPNMDNAMREDGKYYTWIYFVDKTKSIRKSIVSTKTLKRRDKVNLNINYDWYDLYPSEAYVDQVLNTGAKLRHQSRWLNAISIECSESQLTEISHMPFVSDIKPIHQYNRTKLEEPVLGKSLQKNQSANGFDYGGATDQLEQINVHQAHDAGYFGQGVTVLILDSGFNLDHPVFDSLSVIAEWDVINDDSTTKNEDGQDRSYQHNHGTSVFSVLGGYDPGTMIGPAFKADYLLAKTEDIPVEIQTEEDNFIIALEWGENRGADVMSTSVGYIDWYTQGDLDGNTAAITIAVDKAVNDFGMICVASAGNENGNNWDAITPPADAFNVISVGAVNNEGLIAGFSSRGPTADGRTKPEVCAMGVDTYCAHGNGVSYYGPDGTSYAAPLVAGGVAVLLSAHPTWTPGMVREAILETASQSQNEDDTYGWGIMDVWAAINYTSNSLYTPELKQNYPNPFNPNTTIEYELRQGSIVKLVIFDILGREITTLVNNFESSGMKSVKWNGTNNGGYPVSTGIYFYSLIIGDKSLTKKMLMIK